MFTARYVPNMYLFGTFSAQNPLEIASCQGSAFPGFAHGRASGRNWVNRATWRPRNATEGACRAKKPHFRRKLPPKHLSQE